jgi:ATP-binding cassette, subfamily B, bacterial
MPKFPFYPQPDQMDCGPTCLRMVAKYHGKNYSIQNLREKSQISREGVSLLGIAEAAEAIGMRSMAVRISLETLISEVPLPCVVHWQQNHFVVVWEAKKKTSIFKVSPVGEDLEGVIITVADPAKGIITYTYDEFIAGWGATVTQSEKQGIALLLEPTPQFYEEADEKPSKIGFKRLFSYLFQYKQLLSQLVLGLVTGSILQLIFPFLTQSVVDTGVQTQNLDFVFIVLLAQLMLFAGRISIEFIRSWILLHISSRINIAILSDFLIKLMKLPIAYFDTKMYGDIMQRLGDHRRVESFLTGQSLSTLFSLFNLVIFSVVLASYHLPIFGVFLLGSILYTLWITIFLSQRKNLDNKRFEVSSKEQSSVNQLISGMQEIKMNNCERQKRWQWEGIQAKLFRLNMKSLALSQYQQVGAFILNEGKNIFITFLAAKAVISGQLTLGGMLAIQYILGQLNSPVEQLIQFLQSWQDAKLSLERLNEIHTLEDEEPTENPKISILPENKNININNLSFQYVGAGNEPVLKNINLEIPQGKITAIVGTSGSGKTTLLKLLLKSYQANSGEIRLGEMNLKNFSHHKWREVCGTVMQDGFIFSDTIASNIAVADETPDIHKLINAVKVANIQDFVEGLPLSYNTKIGAEGNGISQGQKQRILIARAVYKNPEFLFFDEATNALDANNEKKIMENMDTFFKGKTVVVVAHRLSTVMNAHQIVVLERGEIIEKGTHQELIALQGNYFELVKNQLELAE